MPPTLSDLLDAISLGNDVAPILDRAPELVLAGVAATDERFLDTCGMQLYRGATALHVAAAAHDCDAAGALLEGGADVAASDRRGAQPLHAATRGGPGSVAWDPDWQVAMILLLIDAGSVVDALAAGGVTPLHRAVRNRCSGAVGALLEAGADPTRSNDHGSTAMDLTRWTTGRGGAGSPEARAELDAIVALLDAHAARR